MDEAKQFGFSEQSRSLEDKKWQLLELLEKSPLLRQVAKEAVELESKGRSIGNAKADNSISEPWENYLGEFVQSVGEAGYKQSPIMHYIGMVLNDRLELADYYGEAPDFTNDQVRLERAKDLIAEIAEAKKI